MMDRDGAATLHGEEDIPIAIIGMAFEFPQDATSEGRFWKMLCDARSTSTDFPQDRLNIDAFYHPHKDRLSSISVRRGNFVKENIGTFDAPFFTISPREAECMDPQHRRMLEVAYHALENAGIPITQYSGSKTSVYTGCFTNDYLSILQQDYEAEQIHAAVGIAPSMLANRLSWFFNFKGPSVNLDSACSSSLLALHLACQDLRSGASSMALVGGANLVYHPNFMKMMSDFNFLSPDGRCWSFDERANGYARGEGTAILVIKRLTDALRDGNTIRAVIRGTGSNQDGRTPGITQPSQNAQVELINQVFEQANISKEHTRFFECHGTGTPVGDPIEANAVGAAFKEYRTSDDPLHIGAVKANIGHLEGCSGLAGVIKTVLVLERGLIPPIAGFTQVNSRIDHKALNLHFPTEVVPWPESKVRRACVNSFGFGGTNAIAILDDACHYLKLNSLRGYHRTQESSWHQRFHLRNGDNQDQHFDHLDVHLDSPNLSNGIATDCAPLSIPRLLIWSANDQEGAASLRDAYRHYISQHQLEQDNLAYTLFARRSHHPWRCFTVSGQEGNSKFEDIETSQPMKCSVNVRIAFVFTGQGAQYLGMGRELIGYPQFRESLDRSDKYLKALGCQWSLYNVVNGENTELNIDDPEYSQSLTTCLQIALVDLLKCFGVTPSIVIGHSSGEIAAGYTAGALSHFAAIKVAYYRGILSSTLAEKSKGLSMVAVGLSKEGVARYLDRLNEHDGLRQVTIGCVNSPKNVTLTGDIAQLTILERWFKEDSVFSRWLRVPIAYHSPFMRPIASDYSHAIGKLRSGQTTSKIPMISSVTQDIVTSETLKSSEYWVRNLTSTVEFHGAFSKLVIQANKRPTKKLGKGPDLSITHVLEIGPHHALQGPVRETLQAILTSKELQYVPTLSRNKDAAVAVLTAVGFLHCAGYPVNILQANRLQGSTRPIPPDMPPYPFNHQRTYWKESRLSTNFRFRNPRRHDLLGTRSLDWNPHLAQWRNVIRLSELPWLDDHKINGQSIFPAAAMVCMAMEGQRQLIEDSPNPLLLGIQMRDINFSRPIKFHSETRKVETQLTLSTPASSSNASTTWSYFRLFVLENDTYMECSTGFIRAVTDKLGRDHIACHAPFLGSSSAEQWMDTLSKACQTKLHDPYAIHSGTSLHYGPSFANLEGMKLGPNGEAIAQINIESWKRDSFTSFAPRFAIHPTTLDGMAQLLVPALAQQRETLPTMVPVRIASIWTDLKDPACDQMKLLAGAKTRFRGFRGASADIVATTINNRCPVAYLEGLETAFIDSVEPLKDGKNKTRLLCTQLSWKPDVELLTPEQLTLHCTINRPPQPPDAAQKHELLITVCMYFIEEALLVLEGRLEPFLETHFVSYVQWMKYQQQRLQRGELVVSPDSVHNLQNDPSYRDIVFTELKKSGPDGYFFMHVGQNLLKVLLGEIDALDLMFKDGLVGRYYEQSLANAHDVHPATVYVDLLCFKNPSMKILEVGAGVGGQTLPLLETMSSNGVKKWVHYDYTDISSSFFEEARVKFRRFTDRMSFRVCDISNDPTQSFEAGSYDLVIASHVLHATNDLDQSLRNVRKLLKRGGKLLLFETTQPNAVHMGFAFGLLRGWWDPLNHETRSPHSPCISSCQWHDRLTKTGFSGVDVDIPGQSDPKYQYTSTIISTAVGDRDINRVNKLTLVVNKHIDTQLEAANRLETELSRKLGPCEIVELSELAKTETLDLALTIFLSEYDSVFLDGISEPEYRLLHSILTRCTCVVWITRSETGFVDPRHHLADGLGRVLMSEDSRRKFTTLSLTGWEPGDQMLNTVVDVAERITSCSVESAETNYITHDDALQIARIDTDKTLNGIVGSAILPYHKQEIQLGMPNQIAVQLALSEDARTPEWVECDTASTITPLGEYEVIVEVKTIGLTLRDHLAVTGQIDDLDLGTEGAGIVQAAGERSGFRCGDRVCLISPSAIGSTIRLGAESVSVIPANKSFSEAASIPSAAWLSYHSLVDVAHLDKGETLLIYETSHCVCQVMVQVARLIGANAMVATTSAADFDFLRHELMVPDKNIIYSPRTSIFDQIQKIAHFKAIDVIIGHIQGDAEGDLVTCLAPFGRLVDTSLVNRGSGVTLPIKAPMNISRSSVNFIDLFKRKSSKVLETFQRAVKMVFDNHFKPPQPLHIFQAGDSKAAFDHLKTEINGKVIMELSTSTTVPAKIKTKPRYTFPADATYVIAGGLGGLGRSFARWMATRGARNLVLLSRSGVKGAAARRLIDDLQEQGVCVVTPLVDISDLQTLRYTLRELTNSMPPIKGCIQATVALRDNLFENMTYEDWVVSTRSKVTGSWNLHESLPSDLDFFILMSSVNGIFGGRAQANYAAGNTFKDALAHHRIALGQKAVSIDLGLMVGEGIVAESESLMASMRRIGHLMDIRQEELIALLDHYCDARLPILSHAEAQILVGIEFPSAVLAKGVDIHHSIRRPMFRHLFRIGENEDAAKTQSRTTTADQVIIDKQTALKKAASRDDAVALVTKWLSDKIRQVLGLRESDIDPNKPLHTYGMDSLVAIDLKNWFSAEIGAQIEVFVLLGNSTLREVSAEAAQKTRYLGERK